MRAFDRTIIALLLASALAGCGEERSAPIAPVAQTGGPRRAAEAEEPSPWIVQPHLRRTSGADPAAPPRPLGGGGGGGRASDFEPRLAPEPSAREVEEMHAELTEEAEERVDGEDDPCDQFLDVMRSAREATHRPGGGTPDMPSRDEWRESCRQLPPAYRQCLSPDYFREHIDECNAEMARMARRGERRRESAERENEALRAGRVPGPGGANDDEDPAGGG